LSLSPQSRSRTESGALAHPGEIAPVRWLAAGLRSQSSQWKYSFAVSCPRGRRVERTFKSPTCMNLRPWSRAKGGKILRFCGRNRQTESADRNATRKTMTIERSGEENYLAVFSRCRLALSGLLSVIGIIGTLPEPPTWHSIQHDANEFFLRHGL
jgi:hypothetical protein